VNDDGMDDAQIVWILRMNIADELRLDVEDVRIEVERGELVAYVPASTSVRRPVRVRCSVVAGDPA